MSEAIVAILTAGTGLAGFAVASIKTAVAAQLAAENSIDNHWKAGRYALHWRVAFESAMFICRRLCLDADCYLETGSVRTGTSVNGRWLCA